MVDDKGSTWQSRSQQFIAYLNAGLLVQLDKIFQSNFTVKAAEIADRKFIRIALMRMNLRNLAIGDFSALSCRNCIKKFCQAVLAGLLSLGGIANAQEEKITTKAPEPWFTGPLIAPVGTAVPYGNFMVRSYVFFTTNTGTYDKNWQVVSAEENFYTLNTQFQCFFGLTPWCDLNITPQMLYNTTSNQHYFNSGDLTVGLDFQLMEADFTPYFPGIKFAVREVFPIGNFQFFQPRKLATDQTGAGTFATQFDLVFYKEFPLYDLHWLSTTISAQYTVNAPVNVHGFNAYGGGFGTNGKALPGNSFQGIVSFEVTLSRNWVLTLDSVYTQTDASQFFGIPGISFAGTWADVAEPSSEQLSFAPAIEYNFNSRLGMVAGCWFSVLGRNSTEFRSGVLNFQYTY